MGAAVSNNTAEAVEDVTDQVEQNTYTNDTQVNHVKQDVILKQCDIQTTGDVNIKYASDLYAKNSQISKATQNTNINNDLQQAVLQSATSKVGSLGIGFAQANNSTSMFVNSTSNIVNAMNTVADQFSDSDQEFTCDRSTIKAKNINIDFNNTANFLSDQTVANDQVSSITNKISQKVSQKASATVEGLTGLILAIAIVIAALGYSVAKPLDSGGGKILIAVIVIFLLAFIFGFMYIRGTPPFFNKDDDCMLGSTIGCDSDCVEATESIERTEQTPLRYIYSILPEDITDDNKSNLLQVAVAFAGGKNAINGGYNYNVYLKLKAIIDGYNGNTDLFKMAGLDPTKDKLPYILQDYIPYGANGAVMIPYAYLPKSSDSSQDTNTELGICTPSRFTKYVNTNPGKAITPDSTYYANSSPTNPTDPTGCRGFGDAPGSDLSSNGGVTGYEDFVFSGLNDKEWSDYLNNTTDTRQDIQIKRAMFARYVLSDIIGDEWIPLNYYIDPREIVNVKSNTTQDVMPVVASASSGYDNIYKFDIGNTPYNFRPPLPTDVGGTFQGKFGYCNNNTYKFHKFMRKVGIWIMLALLLAAFGYMAYTWYKNKYGPKEGEEGAEGAAEEGAEEGAEESESNAKK